MENRVPLFQSAPGDDRSGARALCTILAGCNGSGKSSIFKALSPPGRFINANVIARRLNFANPERVSFAAGLSELAAAIRRGDGTMIYDNSSISSSVLLTRIANDLIEVNKLDEVRPLHVRVAAVVGEALV